MLVVNLTRTSRHGPSPLRHPARAVLLLLFAACNSFACSVHFFYSKVLSCLQCAGVLFAVCNFFPCSVHIFLQFPFCLQRAGVDVFGVFFMFARNSFICSVFSLLKR